MTSSHSAYSQAGDEMGVAPGHVRFAPDVSIVLLSVNDSEGFEDEQDNICPNTEQTRTSPTRHERPQLIRRDALEPNFLESPNHGIQSRTIDEPKKNGKGIRRPMLRRSNAFHSY
jgi:hypothetical protein